WMDGMLINRCASPLPPSVFQMGTALEILGNPGWITLPVILANQQAAEACPKTAPEGRNLAVSPEITAEGTSDSRPVAALPQIYEIGPCPAGQNIIAAIAREHHAGMGSNSLEEPRGSGKKQFGAGFGSCFYACLQWFIGCEARIFQDFVCEFQMLRCERGKFGFRVVKVRPPTDGKSLQALALSAL